MKRLGVVAALGITFLLFVSCTENSEQNVNTSFVPNTETKNVVEAFGIVEARNIKNITIDFPAIVENISINDGSKIKKGDILVSLNLSDYLKQIDDMGQELNSAKIELSKVQTDINYLKSDISTKQKYLKDNTAPELSKLINDLKYAEDSYSKSLTELKIKQELLNVGSISQSEFEKFNETVEIKKKARDDAKNALEISRYNMQKEIEKLQSQLDQKMVYTSGVSSIEMLEGNIKVIESSIRLMKEKLNKSYIAENKIVSDVENGVVFDLGCVQGDYVSSSKKLLSIMDIDSIYVNADIPEEFIKDVKLGANVNIKPTADNSRQYEGKVTKISGKAIKKDGETNVPIEISILNNDGFLLPNFNVDVMIEIENYQHREGSEE